MMHNTAHTMAVRPGPPYAIANSMSPTSTSSESMASSPAHAEHAEHAGHLGEHARPLSTTANTTHSSPNAPDVLHMNHPHAKFQNYTGQHLHAPLDGAQHTQPSIYPQGAGVKDRQETDSDAGNLIKLSQISQQGHDSNVYPPTPNHTPIPGTNTSTSASVRRKSVNNNKDALKAVLNDFFPANIQRDANGYPILSRDFVVRRISEGETGRLKEELKCEACGKGYKHITSLAKHLWEHTAEWQTTKKLLISKHQQAQLLEAASILCSIGEKDANNSDKSSEQSDSSAIATATATATPTPTPTPTSPPGLPHDANNSNNKHIIPSQAVPVSSSLMMRRKSKSESSKAGKFGGKRRSKSFAANAANAASAAAVAAAAAANVAATANGVTPAVGLDMDSVSFGSIRRGSASVLPPSDLRRPSSNLGGFRPSISISCSRRGSLLGSLIKEEENQDGGGDEDDKNNEYSAVIYDSDEE